MSKLTSTMLRQIDDLPEDSQERVVHVLEEEVRKMAPRRRLPRGHWARVAGRLAKLNALAGKSEELHHQVRTFRDNFGLGQTRAS